MKKAGMAKNMAWGGEAIEEPEGDRLAGELRKWVGA